MRWRADERVLVIGEFASVAKDVWELLERRAVDAGEGSATDDEGSGSSGGPAAFRFVAAGIGGDERLEESLASDRGTAVWGREVGGRVGELSFVADDELALAVRERFEADDAALKRGG